MRESTFVGECDIDARVPRDTLEIFSKSEEQQVRRSIGSYSMSAYQVGGMTMTELSLSINAAEGASYFRLFYDGGKPIGPAEPTPVDSSFRYMTLLSASIEELSVMLYDSDKNELYTAHLSEDGQTVWRDAPE